MRPAFDDVLTHAVLLLRELPRGRDEVADARTRLERFRETHPGAPVELLVDQPPGSRWVDYDLLLGHPDGGTVSVCWRADSGVPWSVEYAQHWAANFLLTVNEQHVTVQEALVALRFAGCQHPDLMADLVNQKLIAEAIEEDPPPVSDEELQAAADEFRAANSLYSAEATHRWLKEMGLSVERFQKVLSWGIQAQKLAEQVTEGRVAPYFEAHRESFDTVQFFRVDAPTEAVAPLLAQATRDRSLMAAARALIVNGQGRGLQGVLISQPARELPSVLASAPPGAVVGPITEGSRRWVAEVFDRQPAQLDSETRAAIRDILLQEWLAERRGKATVRWHWL